MRSIRVGHDHAAAALGQPARDLRFRRHARDQPDELLGRLVGVGDDDDVGDRSSRSPGTSSRPSPCTSPKAGQRTAKTSNVSPAASRSGRADRADKLRAVERHPRVAHAQDVRQPLAVGLDRGVVSGGGAEVSLPVHRRARRRLLDLPEQESIDPGDQGVGDISSHGQRLGAGKRLRR